MAKLSRPVIYSGLLVVVVAGYLFAQGGNAPRAAVPQQPDSKSSKSKDTDITKEDLDAKFDPVKVEARNIFLPLVARKGAIVGGSGAPPGVPTELTFGEQNWVYTGMAEVDTVPQALLENTGTQDGVFLKQGERWKAATVFQITPDVLTLVGSDGMKYYVKVLGSEEPASPAPAAGFKPLAVAPAPGLQGPIGGGDIQIQPSRRGNRTQGDTNVPNVN